MELIIRSLIMYNGPLVCCITMTGRKIKPNVAREGQSSQIFQESISGHSLADDASPKAQAHGVALGQQPCCLLAPDA